MNTASIEMQSQIAKTETQALHSCLERQRRAYLADRNPSYAQRIRDLKALKSMVLDHRDAIVEAISRDYGNRSRHESLVADIFMPVDGIDHCIKHLKRWMKPQHREIDFTVYPGARNRVFPQPLGVVGVIVPWNFPIQLSLTPLASIFSAGNRAMVKMSENSTELTRLLQRISGDCFPPEKLAFFEETGAVGEQFSRLPFDHLVFTGSGRTGKAVMASAARNLTPVTLELGGKSPAVIAPDYPIKTAVERIMFAKLFNAGQVCVTVDYVFVPQNKVDEFVERAKEYGKTHCPDINSEDYTSIIDQKAFKRLEDALRDAEQKGARLINLAGGQPANPELRKLPPILVLDSSEDMVLRQQEIFGPIMPVLPYRDHQEVVDYITRHERPLAFYPFSYDKKIQDFYLDHVMSGGVCVNDALFHPGQHDLPFGGVGASGMGQYHGYEGFLTFSKLRPVFYQARFSAMKLLAPPYGKLADRIIGMLIKQKS